LGVAMQNKPNVETNKNPLLSQQITFLSIQNMHNNENAQNLPKSTQEPQIITIETLFSLALVQQQKVKGNNRKQNDKNAIYISVS